MKVLVVVDGVTDYWTVSDDAPPCTECNRPWDKHCIGIGMKEQPNIIRVDVELDDGGEHVCFQVMGDIKAAFEKLKKLKKKE